MSDIIHDIIIIGSGPSGATLAESLIEEEKKVLVIDQGYNLNTEIKKNSLDKDSYHPKIIQKKFKYVNYNFKKKNKIVENNFSVLGSLAIGGLSNVWGGGYWEKNENKINLNIDQFLDKNFKIINYDIESSKILTKYLNRKMNENYFKQADLLSLKNENEVYNSKKTIEKLISNKNFNYLKNIFIDKIEKKENFYTCVDENGIRYNCKKLILACGTIGSTRLIIELSNLYNENVKLYHNLNFGFIGYLKESLKYDSFDNHSAYSVFFFNDSKLKKKISGSIGRFNNDLKKLIYKKFFFPFGYIINKFLEVFKYRIIFGNIFFPTEFSETNIKMDINKNLIINGGINLKLNKEKSEILKEFFLKNNKNFYKIYFKKFPIGSDAHYTSTMTQNTNIDQLRTNENGELIKYKNLFISDASILPPDGPHFPTFQIMVNSYKLGKHIAKLDD